MSEFTKQGEKKFVELLECIHHYYPIGMPHIRDEFSGFLELKKITANKIDSLVNNKVTEWSHLVAALEKRFGDKVFDIAYWQFPCYMLRVVLKEEKNDRFEYVQNFIVNISLLCNFYTIYFEDVFFYPTYVSKGATPLQQRVIYFQNEGIGKEHELNPEEIETLLRLHFKEHRYISHKTLFDYKVSGGYPGMESLEDATHFEYPIYSFLFDSLMTYDNLKVVE